MNALWVKYEAVGGTRYRPPSTSEVVDWLREHGAVDYEAAATAWANAQYPLLPWMEGLPIAHHRNVIQTMRVVVDAALGAVGARETGE